MPNFSKAAGSGRTNASRRIAFQLVLMLGLGMASASYADSNRGEIASVKGDVQIIKANGDVVAVRQTGQKIGKGDTVATRADSGAVVKLSEGTITVLSDQSQIQVGEPGVLTQLGGKIYYHFRKWTGSDERKVNTPFATLGVRGTTFIVSNAEGGHSVALQEGKLNVESPGPDFEIHRPKTPEDFNAFRREQEQGVTGMKDEYRRHLDELQQEFVEFRKQFTLEPQRVIRVTGNRVDESGFDASTSGEFDKFEAIGGELLREFRKPDAQH
jgi:hypothetical protein